MKFIKDKSLGYMVAYNPTHQLANKAGKVYEHIYVMSQSIGRILTFNEHVHHIDRDRSNNNLDNLLMLLNEEHGLLHHLENRFVPKGTIKSIDDLYKCRETYYTKVKCLHCNKSLDVTENSDKQYCSNNCFRLSRRKFNTPKEELEKLVWEMPTSTLSKLLNVSDVAIAKRCKLLGIEKPARGYWAKLEKKN